MFQDFFSIASLIFSIGISLAAITVSIRTARLQEDTHSYSDIDNIYAQILDNAIKYPDLRNMGRITAYRQLPEQDEFRLRYETYAFMCWNLVETIFDRTQDTSAPFGISITWMPVVLEESRLHYEWFCHNLRLFKKPFQDFVSKQVVTPEFQRYVLEKNDAVGIRLGDIHDFAHIYPFLEQDFPIEERKSRDQFERLLAGADYKLYIIENTFLHIDIGYALMLEPASSKLAWLDYLAVFPEYRNTGVGTATIQKLLTLISGRLGILLEVEKPTSTDPTTLRNQRRRITFYERINAKQLAVDYLFPTVEEPLPMYLFFRSATKLHVLKKQDIQQIITDAYSIIHSDVPGREVVLNSFINSIHDVAL